MKRFANSNGTTAHTLLSRAGVAIAAMVLITVFTPAASEAMQFTARVTGTVIDAEGNPLEGVKVTIALRSNRQIDPVPPWEVATDDKGFYFVRDARVTDMRITFELAGYETVEMERELRNGPNTFNVTMNIDAAAVAMEKANVANEHYTAGYDAFMAQDFPAAAQHLEQALGMFEDVPENAEARGSIVALLGRAYYEQNDFETAAAYYELWATYHPTDANAHVELAQVLNDMGNNDEAMEHFETALSLDPDDPTSLYNIGVVMVNSGSVPEGVALIERSLEIRPDFPLALRNIGYAYARMEEYQKAVDAFEKYLEQSPDADDAAQIQDFVVALKEMIG